MSIRVQSSLSSLASCQLQVVVATYKMATALAGEVLGPRPGKAIFSLWQGVVEIGLRIVVPIVSNPFMHAYMYVCTILLLPAAFK